jgi:hypothetical protein
MLPLDRERSTSAAVSAESDPLGQLASGLRLHAASAANVSCRMRESAVTRVWLAFKMHAARPVWGSPAVVVRGDAEPAIRRAGDRLRDDPLRVRRAVQQDCARTRFGCRSPRPDTARGGLQVFTPGGARNER